MTHTPHRASTHTQHRTSALHARNKTHDPHPTTDNIRTTTQEREGRLTICTSEARPRGKRGQRTQQRSAETKTRDHGATKKKGERRTRNQTRPRRGAEDEDDQTERSGVETERDEGRGKKGEGEEDRQKTPRRDRGQRETRQARNEDGSEQRASLHLATTRRPHDTRSVKERGTTHGPRIA